MNRLISRAVRALLVPVLALSCAEDQHFASNGGALYSDGRTQPLSPVAAPAAPTGASHPFARHALPQASRRWITGQVEERVLAGNYVYLRIREPSGIDSWFVSLKATTPTAPDVHALIVGRAEHFHSRQLERDFSPLLFAAVRPLAN